MVEPGGASTRWGWGWDELPVWKPILSEGRVALADLAGSGTGRREPPRQRDSTEWKVMSSGNLDLNPARHQSPLLSPPPPPCSHQRQQHPVPPLGILVVVVPPVRAPPWAPLWAPPWAPPWARLDRHCRVTGLGL